MLFIRECHNCMTVYSDQDLTLRRGMVNSLCFHDPFSVMLRFFLPYCLYDLVRQRTRPAAPFDLGSMLINDCHLFVIPVPVRAICTTVTF